jgi:AcrR family transcriptional regulator
MGALKAVDGRTPGQRGRATRERLLVCTAALLEQRPYRDVTVIEIARRAGTSPATFYQYFPDVEAAVLDLAQRMAEQAQQLPGLIERSDWRGKAGFEAARALTDGFLDLWEQHRAVLRVVDLATAEGDLRFQNIRTHLLHEITARLREVIERFKVARRHPARVDPMAHAATLVSMLAHVAAHRYGMEFWGIKTADVRESAARVLYEGVTGKRAPS